MSNNKTWVNIKERTKIRATPTTSLKAKHNTVVVLWYNGGDMVGRIFAHSDHTFHIHTHTYIYLVFNPKFKS